MIKILAALYLGLIIKLKSAQKVRVGRKHFPYTKAIEETSMRFADIHAPSQMYILVPQ